MKLIQDFRAEPAEQLSGEGLLGVQKRLLIGPADGTPLMALRIFTVAVGGHTPRHRHDWEHMSYVIAGHGVLETADGPRAIGPGMVIFVEPGEEHQFRNPGDEPLEFICLVPNAYA